MLAIDGVGFDWSDIAEEPSFRQTSWLLNGAFSDSKCDDLLVKLNESEFKATTYKRGLATLEDQIITYKKNEIIDKSKKGLGFSAVPSPHPLIYNRPKNLDLSYSSLDEFKEPEFKGYGPENSEQESNVVCDKKPDNSKENYENSLVEEQVSQDTSSFIESSPNVDKETIFPVNKKINYDNHQRKGIVSRNNYSRVDAKTTHPSVHRNMSPKAVLLKTGLTPLNTVRPFQYYYTATISFTTTNSTVHSANSKSHFSNQAQSTAQRPFYKQTTLTRRSMHTTKRHYYTGRPRVVNTARSYTGQVSAVRVKGGKPQQDDKGFVDSGCSRHMTGNIAYLSDFKEFDGGYVAFGGGAYGGSILGTSGVAAPMYNLIRYDMLLIVGSKEEGLDDRREWSKMAVHQKISVKIGIVMPELEKILHTLIHATTKDVENVKTKTL
ncbi:hypothetical protein Tco_0015637 [Tanacetum coccineum]